MTIDYGNSAPMTTIAGSSAVLQTDRVLVQHQAVLTLIKDRLEDPNRPSFKWLDLACGRGQILAHLDLVLSQTHREKIEYLGLDIEQQHVREAERLAAKLLANSRFEVCELHRFEQVLSDGERFDIVTCTNTVHEISPSQLADTFVGCVCRTDPSGSLFLYDMESLPKLELGAIPWTGKEIEEIIRAILVAAGEYTYSPQAATWPHRSCNGWHIGLNRSYLGISDATLLSNRTAMRDKAAKRIEDLLKRKLLTTHQVLETAAKYGPETESEAAAIQALTYNFWAIARALNAHLILPSAD